MSPQELPKISTFTQLLATPETQFESLVKEALKLELPPGPQSTLLKLQTSLEAGKAPSLEAVVPKAPKPLEVLAELPALPKLPAGEAVQTVESVKPPAETVGRKAAIY